MFLYISHNTGGILYRVLFTDMWLTLMIESKLAMNIGKIVIFIGAGGYLQQEFITKSTIS